MVEITQLGVIALQENLLNLLEKIGYKDVTLYLYRRVHNEKYFRESLPDIR